MNLHRIGALLLSLLLVSSLSACKGGGGGGGLDVKLINNDFKKPNNVWVFFTVEQGDDPVGGLTAEDFVIYEDGKEVSKFESKQIIQNPEVAAVMYTMLLVDMSGSISESDSGKADDLVDAAKSFSERVGKSQKVGVYAFDGEAKIHSVTPFTEAQGSVQGGLEGLRKYKPKDPSTNLHGAVVEGLRELKKSLDKEKKPLKFGTLVVFCDGSDFDRAGRLTRDEMMEEIDKEDYEHYEMYAIGVGGDKEMGKLSDFGRDGTVLAKDQAKLKEAFDGVAARLEAHMKRFYLFSYCTPARKGEHEVRIEARRRNPEGSGSLESKFNADNFGPPPECKPETPPTFDLKKIDTEGEEGGGKAGASVSVSGSAEKK